MYVAKRNFRIGNPGEKEIEFKRGQSYSAVPKGIEYEFKYYPDEKKSVEINDQKVETASLKTKKKRRRK